MKIEGYENDKTILAEIGKRIKENRITIGLTQKEFAEKCGVSVSTITRIESGEDSAFSNYIKILREFGVASNIDVLILEAQPNYRAIFEKQKPRRRVRKRKADEMTQITSWIWGEDKDENGK